LADPVNFQFSPRNILKDSIRKSDSKVDPMIELSFAAGFSKFKPDDAQPTPHDFGISS
jgi:hypothetical protein